MGMFFITIKYTQGEPNWAVTGKLDDWSMDTVFTK